MKEEIKNAKNAVEYTIQKLGTYFVTCKKNTADKNCGVRKTKQNRLMIVSNCAICDKKKPMFKKEVNQLRLILG